jgi:hypothetical protein
VIEVNHFGQDGDTSAVDFNSGARPAAPAFHRIETVTIPPMPTGSALLGGPPISPPRAG